MSSFTKFLKRMTEAIGLDIDLASFRGKKEYELAANILNEINGYLYQHKKSLPKEYISDFHEYWEHYHEKILDPKIDKNNQCEKVANILEVIYRDNDVKVQLNTLDLSKKEIADVRFFTAIQDFNIDVHAKNNPFEFYRRHPQCFMPKEIVKNDLLIDEFLNYLSAESQRDKRKPWMQNAAHLLIEKYNGSAYEINRVHDGDVLKIIDSLSRNEKYGLSIKKTHMLLRDMADLDVWDYKHNVEKLDVMSDRNTMRVALRTGIMGFRIPLLASYLDVHCHQYALVDKINREAWREVWCVWGILSENHRPPTPASIDYLIYRLGKIACKRTRRRCPPEKPINQKKYNSIIPQDRLIFNKDYYCIFSDVCDNNRKHLNAPKSISIMGRTGWQSGQTNDGGGGGISS